MPPFWDQLTNRRGRGSGPGANVVFTSAATPIARARVVVNELNRLAGHDYVIFANHEDANEYIQFARNGNGTLLMEVASGEYTRNAPRRLIDSELAVTTLAQLGLSAQPGANFSAPEVTAEPPEIAEWIEQIFVNLFRLDEGFTMDVLGAPSRRGNTSAAGSAP